MFNGLKRGIVICACAALAVSCMDYGPIEKEDFEIDNAGSGDEVTGNSFKRYVVISHFPENQLFSTSNGTLTNPNSLKCSKQFISIFKRKGIVGGISDSIRNNIVLLYRFCFVTLSGKKLKTSPSLNMIGFIGPGVICTKSISSLYLGCGDWYGM